MARGGARAGAGRKAGSPNKATAERQAEVAASGLTPLDYMLQVMRDEERMPDVRLDAAKAAAPYVHPKLASIDMNADLNLKADDTIAGLLARIASEGKRLAATDDKPE